MSLSSQLHLHVVSFNVPFPANYGGVIDVFYKLRALHALGVKIHLHNFIYGREAAPVLDQICHKVYYYQRKRFANLVFGRLPYIVASRNNKELLQNLLLDNHPILFEGLHCCYYLPDFKLKGRNMVVRMHNLEDVYYQKLSATERNPFKKYFFQGEAQRLKQYEKVLTQANKVAAISPADRNTLQERYANSFYLPVFHANDKVVSKLGMGDYALYQGNLGVGENNEAALWLVNEIFNDLKYPLKIVGMNPSRELRKAIEGKSHISLYDKVTTAEIVRMTQAAQINVLPTFQNTGMKLKLINVLFQGRFIIVNSTMVENTELENYCTVVDSVSDWKNAIIHIQKQNFTESDVNQRVQDLTNMFNNLDNAELLMAEFASNAKVRLLRKGV